MLDNGEKRIIRIKDVESNCIEEMIVILKDNARKSDINKLEYRFVKEDDNSIIREAEAILENYINDNMIIQKYENSNERYSKFKIDLNKLLNYSLILSIIVIGYMIFANIRK